jgi:hypothetical protein
MQLDKDENFANFIEGKRVAYVGPSPHLIGRGMGKLIDSYDVVVKVNEAISSPRDYGARMDVINNCLNNDYAPLLGRFLKNNPEVKKNLKYIMCGERCVPHPDWPRTPDTMKNYEIYIKEHGIPFYVINQEQRYEIKKEVRPKTYVENGISNTANFNNGYAGILMLLRYDIKELFITGINFYNFGLSKGLYIEAKNRGFKKTSELTDSEKKQLKYHDSYIDYYKSNGHVNYKKNFTANHDQLAQIRHFREVIIPGHPDVLKIDDYLKENLYTESLNKRLEWHATLA